MKEWIVLQGMAIVSYACDDGIRSVGKRIEPYTFMEGLQERHSCVEHRIIRCCII